MNILRICGKAMEKIALCSGGIRNRFIFAANDVKFTGRPLEINGAVTVQKSSAGQIVIGRNLKMNSGKAWNAIGGDSRTILKTVGKGEIRIGEGVGISNSAFVSACSITLGDRVMVGGGCRFWDTDFHPLDPAKRGDSFETPGEAAPIRVGAGAFIGAGTIVLKGTVIGENAVIGAGSVVTGEIPAGEVWAGNPIRKIC